MQRRKLVLGSMAVAFVQGGCARNITIPVADPISGEMTAQLEAFIYRPVGPGPFPVLILNHGSDGGKPKASISWSGHGAYWSARGYIVIAPMRRGRGRSTGTSPESEQKNCTVADWFEALPFSLQDLDAVVQYSEALPNAKLGAITLLGASRGGFLSVAYAAEGQNRSKIRSVVNFVGGWVAQAEDQCPQDFNLIAFSRFGRKTSTPMLWLYGANDLFYGDEAVKSYARQFGEAGGVMQFHLIDKIPKNGHDLLDHPARWRTQVDDFLSATNSA